LLLRQKISLVPIKARPAVFAPTRKVFVERAPLSLVLRGRSPVAPTLCLQLGHTVVADPFTHACMIHLTDICTLLHHTCNSSCITCFSSARRRLAVHRLGTDSVSQPCTWTFAVSTRTAAGPGGFLCLLAEPHVHEPQRPAYWSERSRGFADPPSHGCGQKCPSYIARDKGAPHVRASLLITQIKGLAYMQSNNVYTTDMLDRLEMSNTKSSSRTMGPKDADEDD
jgi:hypothetical protein